MLRVTAMVDSARQVDGIAEVHWWPHDGGHGAAGWLVERECWRRKTKTNETWCKDIQGGIIKCSRPTFDFSLTEFVVYFGPKEIRIFVKKQLLDLRIYSHWAKLLPLEIQWFNFHHSHQPILLEMLLANKSHIHFTSGNAPARCE